MMTKEQLTALASVQASPAVSIYLPGHEDDRDIRQGAVRLKNALSAATDRLVEQGHRRPEVDALLAPAQALYDDEQFWRQERGSLAIFVAPGLFQVHKVPMELPETTVVGPRPHVKPLLPLLADDGRFFVLTATAGDTQLYVASRFGLTEVEADIPRSVAEVTAETDYENTRRPAPLSQSRRGGAIGVPAPQSYGEAPEEQRKAQLIEHLRRLQNALERCLGGTQAPIVLVAQPEVEGHLKALAKGITFHETVQTDPDSLDRAELHRRAYELVRPKLAQRRADDLDRFKMLAGSNDPRGATDLPAIVSAARFGRVDTLLVAEGASVWGICDEEGDRVRVNRESTPDNQDLVDYAAVQTLLRGGNVHVLSSAEEMPREGCPMVAILRF
ncbi:hypothetical protein [Benzoatithermus flavus]|uniref:Uncharacterized protein n=1 Tax=Benzoatithermus flavus TaxID=3108223 RepID=A0ABU8XNS1_9PROT